MSEFNRTTAILAELASLTDYDTARHADITFTFTTDEGERICRVLRESVAEEYRAGNVDWQDRVRVAATVGQGLTKRADTLAWFAAIHDILTLTTTTEYDPDQVFVADGSTMGESVTDALRVRFTQAAYALLTYLEQNADEKQFNYDPGDSEE